MGRRPANSPRSARMCRSPGRCATPGSWAWCSTSPPTPTVSGSTRCSTTPTCSSRPKRCSPMGPTAVSTPVPSRRVIRISSPSPSPRSDSTARSPSTSPPTRLLSATGGIAFKAGVPTDTPLFPPGHLVDDLVSITSAFAALCALYQREHTGAGQFVELSANEAVALCADWALPNVSARVLAGEPPAEVRSGSGPVYPVFKCTDGYVRLVVLSPRQWRALREWLGDPEYLQDPELESFVARLMIAAAVINPLLEEHFARVRYGRGRGRSAATRDRVHTRVAPGARGRERAPAFTEHVRAPRRRRRCDRARVHRLLRDQRRARRSAHVTAGDRRAHRAGLRQPRRRARTTGVDPRSRPRPSRVCGSWTSASARSGWRSAAASPSTAPR